MTMGRVQFVSGTGASMVVDVEFGQTLMSAALKHNVSGIRAECGGAASCATCHVVLDAAASAVLPSPSPVEDDLLDFVETERQPTSRLSCQIVMSEALDGARILVP